MTKPLAQITSALAGRYDIEREIGAGGMATVYLARDTKHARHVAVKVLSPELGAVLGTDRFLSEIRVTANLQHPNLLPLFDSGEADGLLYYVMPFIAGESLRSLLEREKQLPIDDAVHIATSIASALDYAHRQGVIHRDLKPENILLYEGQPLIADFGIALAVSKAGGSRITQTGLSLGTPQYMSPEQATGDRAIDGRTDIYSLGAMLYEMLVGDPPYTGSTTQAVIAKVITEQPRRVRSARNAVPAHVDAAVDRALAKLPADRWHTAHEFADALHGKTVPSLHSVSAAAMEPSSHQPPSRARRLAASPWPWAAGLLLTLLVWAWDRTQRALPAPIPTRFSMSLMPNERVGYVVPQPIGLSPDGRSIVYRGSRMLFVRELTQLRSRSLPGTENAVSPAVSPDGKWVAFVALGKLRKTPIEGGPTSTIADAYGSYGLSWISNDELVFVKSTGNGGTSLQRVSAGGGEPTQITSPDSLTPLYPWADLNHEIVLHTVLGREGFSAPRLAVTSLETGTTTELGVDGTNVLANVDGRLIYVRVDGVLMAVPFDPRRLKVTGSPLPLTEVIGVQVVGAAAALSSNGTLVYMQGASTSQVVLVDEAGQSRTLLDEKRRYFHPRYSPDGRRIAFDVASSATTDVWVADIASGTFTRLTTVGSSDRPEWEPDGRRILFLSNRNIRGDAPWSIWRQLADGSLPAERVFEGRYDIREAVPTPDGRALVYREDHPGNLRDIHLLPLDTPRVSRPLFTGRFDELMTRISPDGRLLAYLSDESGQAEVYLAPFPGVSGRVQVSVGGGTEPLWSRDGKRLFYRNGGQLVSASIASTPSIAVTGRTVLFESDYATHPYHPNYDVAPDGRQFVMLKQSGDEAQLVVVINWTEDLRQRIGLKR